MPWKIGQNCRERGSGFLVEKLGARVLERGASGGK
jgi:hypothetical protein